jgi:hypothetical protein
MQLVLKGRVSDIYEGANRNYVTFNDTINGGSIKLGLPKETAVKMDGLYNLDMVVKPGTGKDGMYLSVLKIQSKGE